MSVDRKAPGLLVANLDVEESLGTPGADRRRRRTLPATVRRSIAPLGTLLRVFVRSDDDLLWLPDAVSPKRLAPRETLQNQGSPRCLAPRDPESPNCLAPRESLPRPRLVTGQLDRLGPVGDVLAWAETDEVSALRGGGDRPRSGSSEPLHRRVWHLPRPAPAVARRVLSRSFAHGLAIEGEIPLLAGCRLVASVAEIEAAVAGPPPPGALGWVTKALYGASGRHRLVHRGWTAPAGSFLPRLKSLLERSGELLFEPWMDRVDDFGSAGIVVGEEGERVEVLGSHRLEVDARGVFRGIDLAEGSGLSRQDEASLAEVMHAVGRALGRAGYRGPFGVDAWRYRLPDGSTRFHPAGEVNARMTFGLVARAWMERWGVNPLAR